MKEEKNFLEKLGFTLIELLVVVSIIGVLTTLVVANLNSARERARDAQRKSDLHNIQIALRLYYNDKQGYPGYTSSGLIKGCDPGGTTVCDWGTQWIVGTTIYMNKIPADPLGIDYKYEGSLDNESYKLSACLENLSDDKGIPPTYTGWCSSGVMYQIKS